MSSIDEAGINPYVPAGQLSTGLPVMTPPVGINGVYPITPATGNLANLPTTKSFTRGYIQSYNVTLQRELPFSMFGSVGYVGTHVVNNYAPMDINYATLGGGPPSEPFAQFSITRKTLETSSRTQRTFTIRSKPRSGKP